MIISLVLSLTSFKILGGRIGFLALCPLCINVCSAIDVWLVLLHFAVYLRCLLG